MSDQEIPFALVQKIHIRITLCFCHRELCDIGNYMIRSRSWNALNISLWLLLALFRGFGFQRSSCNPPLPQGSTQFSLVSPAAGNFYQKLGQCNADVADDREAFPLCFLPGLDAVSHRPTKDP